MRAVLQRVSDASVSVEGVLVSAIGAGLVALVGVADGDTLNDAAYIAGKIADARVFAAANDAGAERSLLETGGAALVISQFTLLGDCRKGRRPSWSSAASPEQAIQYYETVITLLRERGVTVATGTFRAAMRVTLTGDGPFTLLLDSKKAF